MRNLYIYVRAKIKNGQKTRIERSLAVTFKRVRSRMALRMTSFKSYFTLHRLFPLRQRYILAKSGGVRLRYRCVVAMFAVSILGTSFASFIPEYTANARVLPVLDHEEVASALKIPAADEPVTLFDVSADMQDKISESIRLAPKKLLKAPRSLEQTLKVGKGQTIAGILQDAGLGGDETARAMKALKVQYDPRRVKAGQTIDVRFKKAAIKEGDRQKDDWNVELAEMKIPLSPLKTVTVKRDGEKFISDLKEPELRDRTNARQATIQTSVYGSAAKSGIPSAVVAQLIRAYSHNIDFQRDIRRGDSIEVLYESKETENGTFAKLGDVLYANLTVGGREMPIYRHKHKDGRVGFYYANGKSIRKTLLRTPINGARMSSGYGMRRHPVLGYNKMHKGVDFAAPTGTKIYAAGDGVLTYAGRKGSYGKYISIRHNGKISTAYAHLSRLAKGMRKGKRVKQGQVIGYVGSTGRSTGPHLHYEVLVHGKQVNPGRVDLPTGESLSGAELKRFKANIASYNQEYASRVKPVEVASIDVKPSRKKTVQ